MIRRMTIAMLILTAQLTASGSASAGGFSFFKPKEPARPELLDKIHEAKLKIVSGDLKTAKKLTFALTAHNKAEKKALNELHIDLMRPHLALSNAHLAAGDVEGAAVALVEAKEIVHTAGTLNQSSLGFHYPSGSPHFEALKATMARIEIKQAAERAAESK